jgi:serine O-acetyltransferase
MSAEHVDAQAAMEGQPFLGQDVRRLIESIKSDERTRHIDAAFLPDRDAVVIMVQRLRELMFPGFFGERDLNEHSIEGHVQRLVEGIGRDLFEQVTGALRYQKHLAPGEQPL